MLDYGYAGRVLFVDLTRREIWIEELKEDYARDFIGGFGLVARLAYDYLPKRCDPFSPENAMIMASGALGGTPAPGSSKLHMGAKMANYRVGAAGAGGNMGFMLKHSGFDAAVITGKADSPSVALCYPVDSATSSSPDIRLEIRDWGLGMGGVNRYTKYTRKQVSQALSTVYVFTYLPVYVFTSLLLRRRDGQIFDGGFHPFVAFVD